MRAHIAGTGVPKPHLTPRQEERQRRILDEARRQIAAIGYDAINMQDLAEASEVSTKTLYNLYGSKDELLLAAVENVLNNLRLQPTLLGVRSGVESLLAVCDASAQFVVNSPNYAEAMARTFFQIDPRNPLAIVLVEDTRKQAEEAFIFSQKEGEIEPTVDVLFLAEIFTAQQWGLILSWSKGLIATELFPKVALRSQLSAIAPVSKGKLKRWLKAKAASSDLPF